MRKYLRHASIKASGPYRCWSQANGDILIRPSWPQFKPWTAVDGGGPPMAARRTLADDLAALLNGKELL